MKNPKKPLPKSHQAGRHFLSMNSMLKCIQFYIEFLKHEQLVTAYTKHNVNKLDMAIKSFMKEVEKTLPKDVLASWNASWEERDFLSISNVLDHWVEMDDKDRGTLELVCAEMRDGNFKVELES